MGQPAADPVLAHHNVRALPLEDPFARSSPSLARPLVRSPPPPMAYLSARRTRRCARQRHTATCSPRKPADVAPTSSACVCAVSLHPRGL